jgi:NhaP-type Na+/H+ or K+/H+ antiporter
VPDLLTGFALIAVVLTVSALVSPLIERAPISFPMIFLGLGFVLGPAGARVVNIDSQDRTLEIVATLSLSFVLFLDAVKLQADEVGRDWLVPVLSLGPGTLLTIGLVALAAVAILGTGPVPALLLGSILASTDPVVLRDVVRDHRIPGSVRHALSVEAGTNDIVVLPIVLVLIAIAQARVGDASSWLVFLGQLFVLGPLAGFAVGGLGSWVVAQVSARLGMRREHEAIYGVGLVLAAYAAGVAVGGDGLLAAFAAGLAVTVLNHELCDCFLEYGETTAEMAMLLAFIFFGALLSTLIGSLPLAPTLVFAALVIVVARPLAFGLVLLHARLSPGALAFIAWFGPRGLSSLLFALLLAHRGVPGAESVLAVVGVVVIASVVVHGVTATPIAAWYGRRMASVVLAEERESLASGLLRHAVGTAPRISVEELSARLAGPDPPLVLDVRTRSSYAQDPRRIPGSVRVLPDEVSEWVAGQTGPRGSVVAYCT